MKILTYVLAATDDREAFQMLIGRYVASRFGDGARAFQFADHPATLDLVWHERHGVMRLLDGARPGDHIIAARFDHICRDFADLGRVLPQVAQRDAYLHVLDLSLDTSTDEGTNLARTLDVAKAKERRPIGARRKATKVWKRERGLPTNQKAPVGWRKIRHGRESRFVPDPESRRIAYIIVSLKDEDDLSYRQIFGEMLRRRIPTRGKGDWGVESLRQWYKAARSGFPLPCGARQHLFDWEPALWRSWGIQYSAG